jgi:membrane protein
MKFSKRYRTAAKKFSADNDSLRAAALTYYTLFAVVPILATAFGVAKGFGLESFLNEQLEKAFPGQETMVVYLSQYAHNLLNKSSGGIIVGVGLLVLFYSVYSMLSHIEHAFNNIWKVSERRPINQRISSYLSLILIGPVLLVAAGSLKLFIAKQLATFNIVLAWSSKLISLGLIILFFTWLYQFVPNARVRTKAALFGGLHTGIAYTLIQSLLIESQMLMNNYGAIYGSLAALPMFLLWVQITWNVVLYGAQLCYEWQEKS